MPEPKPDPKQILTDSQLSEYLRDNGYPERVAREGRPGLLRRWRAFVEQVERGYSLGLEDYRNDLDVRAIIALAGLEDDTIRGLDERFRKLLTAPEIRVWESAAGDPFWDFGYPANAGQDLLSGLREEELIP
jgi:hypothetical protein